MVEKVVMDAEIQIIVQADGVVAKNPVLRSGSEDEQDIFVVSDGRVLKGNEELGICGVRDGSTVQVVKDGNSLKKLEKEVPAKDVHDTGK